LRRNAPPPPWADKKSIDNILGGCAASRLTRLNKKIESFY